MDAGQVWSCRNHSAKGVLLGWVTAQGTGVVKERVYLLSGMVMRPDQGQRGPQVCGYGLSWL